MLLSTLDLGAGLLLWFLPTTCVRLLLWKSRASFPTSPTTSPAFAAMQGRPNKGRYRWKLLGHCPQQAELTQVPELERGGSEGNDEVLLALAHSDHCYSLLFWFSAWVVSQVSASTCSKVGRHKFISHLVIKIKICFQCFWLTRLEPVMRQCARERTDAAGWLLVHSIAATAAVCTASSLGYRFVGDGFSVQTS